MLLLLEIILIIGLISAIGAVAGYFIGKYRCKNLDYREYMDRAQICEKSYKKRLRRISLWMNLVN